MSEVRIKRAKFTKVLHDICAALDQMPIKTVAWKSHNQTTGTARVEVLSLWVAGSYARGALLCGDLDLVMEYKALNQARLPSMRSVKTAFIKKYSRVGIFEGTPSENDSGIELREAILLWQGKGFDWQTAIANIKENPLAGHHPRKSDAIPLRPLQLAMHIEDVEALVYMQEKEIINWQFTPLTDLNQCSPEFEEELYFEHMMSCTGLKTQKLFPYLLSYFKRQTLQSGIVLRNHFDKTHYAVNGAQAFVGNPIVPIKQLDAITTAELVIMPHISARGPNGVWAIKRGAKHPLSLAFENISLYCFVDEQGKSLISLLSKQRLRPDWNCARVIELFSSIQEAKDYASNFIEDALDDSEVMLIQGNMLLDLIAYVDVVSINGEEYAMTPTGCQMLMDDEMLTTQALMNLLTTILQGSATTR